MLNCLLYFVNLLICVLQKRKLLIDEGWRIMRKTKCQPSAEKKKKQRLEAAASLKRVL
jgi:hypothetical protein